MKLKTILIAFACVFLKATLSPADAAPVAQLPSAFLPAGVYNFPEVLEGVEIVHDFVIFNKGAGPLHIQKVQTG